MGAVERAVESLVKKHKTADPWLLCEKLGVVVLISDLPPGVKGVYQSVDGRGVIHISRWISNTQMKLVCAHELAHVVLHKNQNLCRKIGNARMEQEAEVFKRCLLGLEVKDATKLTRADVSSFTHLSNEMLILDF